MVLQVFNETIRQTWRQTLIWASGFAALTLLVIAMLPAFDMVQLAELFKQMPEWLLSMAGVANVDVITTPEGFVAVGVFAKFAVFFAIYPLIMGMRVSTNDEDAGMLDVVLSQPLPRWAVIAGSTLAYIATFIVLIAFIFAAVVAGQMFINIDLNLSMMAVIVVNLFPSLLFVLAVVVFLGALIGRRRPVMWLSIGFLIASYMLQTLAGIARGTFLEGFGRLSFFHYYNPEATLATGIVWSEVMLLVGLSAILLATGVWVFNRRDIAV
jgi:ABC-2 type transport system permease protein